MPLPSTRSLEDDDDDEDANVGWPTVGVFHTFLRRVAALKVPEVPFLVVLVVCLVAVVVAVLLLSFRNKNQ